ncbi:hypothetical protein GCM10023196_082270 [Actinoallomurus vinaceus]|uniref:Uncharacterized protein n=1 Tax=Actinoallomurus vinaceus TaxID=1080074 RepID=A0ABP8UN27_9ACTN
MDPVLKTAGTAIVGAMATDMWQQARTSVVRLWRRADSAHADAVANELEEVRARMLAARSDGDDDTEQALAGLWRLRLQDLVRQDPSLADELRRVVDEELLPTLGPAERARTVLMYGTASGHGRVYQSARDQHINQR